MTIDKSILQFLNKLSENNNREWFADHKPEFDAHNKNIKSFYKEVNDELALIDHIENHSVFRIYRDVRFSKDKKPYKSNFSGYFRRATAALRGGYFLNIEPGNTFVGGGFYGPNKEDLLRIRQEFEQGDEEIREITNHPDFISTFGTLLGEELKTAPRGFDKEHKAIDLIRKKQFYVQKSFTDKEVLSGDFQKKVVLTFKELRPFFDYMSDVLTTDLNGESVLLL